MQMLSSSSSLFSLPQDEVVDITFIAHKEWLIGPTMGPLLISICAHKANLTETFTFSQ